MNKLIYMLIIMLSLPLMVSANNGGGNDNNPRKKKSSSSIRADRKIAVTAVTGWNSLVGAGVVGSYYIQPKIGIDAGFGIGLKGGKVGARGRYLFTENNFAPYVGLGLDYSMLNANDVLLTTDDFEVVTYDINRTLFGQLTVGFEYMSNGGFVIGLNVGYALAITDPYTVTEGTLDDTSKLALGIAHGGGLATEFSIGYAF